MGPVNKSLNRDLQHRIKELEARLSESEETLRAIREGEVDAIVVRGSKGDQVFSLFGAESAYRLIVDTMSESAFTVSFEGKILYCNAQFGRFLGSHTGQIIGHSIQEFVAEDEKAGIRQLLTAAGENPVKRRLVFQNKQGTAIPAHISANLLDQPDGPTLCFVVSDLRELENSTELIQQLRSHISKRKYAEEALKESEFRFRQLFEDDLTGDFIAGPDGEILLCNPAYVRIFGFPSREDAIGSNIGDLHQDRNHFSDFIHLLEERKALINFEAQRRRVDGKSINIIENVIGTFDEEGRLVQMKGYVFDNTERKQAENELRSSERRFRVFFESNMVGTIFWNMDGLITDANDKFLRMVGYTREDLINGRLDWAQLTPHEYRALDEYALDELRTRGFDTPYEKEFVRKDGTRLPIIIGAAMLDERRYEGIAFVLDITESKRAEKALRESESFYRQTLESIPGMVFTTRPDGYPEYQSRQWDEYSSQTLSEHPGENWTRLLHPDDRARALDAWRASVEQEVPYNIEYRVRRYDGQYEWFKVFGRPIRDSEGRIVRWFGVAFNIEELKRTEHELAGAKYLAERAKASAEEANRAKDHFLAVLSHELRTPLTPVMMGVSMLQDRSNMDPQVREVIDMIRSNIEMEARLIDDLLDVTRIARGKIELNRTPVDICSIIGRAVEVCRPDIEGRKLEFGIDCGPAAEYSVDGDASRLEQVFWNLLKNAVKFTPHGGCVGIRCRRDQDQVVIEVNDSGIGIEPEALSRVFDAFEQAERSITRQFGGLGLGLAISKAIVELHGGRIEAHSGGRDKGSSFILRLPLCPPSAKAAPIHKDQPSQSIVRPLRILLVEDHGVTARMIRTVLSEAGHRVEMAGDVTTALELADSSEFDLLLSDLGLPDGSGHDLMRKLREKGLKLPGIALSGYGQEQDIQQSYAAGFAAHLTKPASRKSVLDSVSRVTNSGSDLHKL